MRIFGVFQSSPRANLNCREHWSILDSSLPNWYSTTEDPLSRKDLQRWPGFNPITFTFSKNSNHWWKSLLEVIRQNIAGWCQKLLMTTPSNVLPSHLKQTFPPIIWIFTEGGGDGIQSRLPFKIFSTFPNIFRDLRSSSSQQQQEVDDVLVFK